MIVVLLACARCTDLRGSGEQTCRVDGWDDRDAIVHLPASWDGESTLPLVLAFHGGGGKASGFNTSTCLDGDDGSPTCLSAVADREGFAVVYPNGTSKLLGSLRSWNAGGGADGWRCVGGKACDDGVDDVQYTRDLLDQLGESIPVGPVFATGISNGGAMSHRLACDLPDRISAIVSVAGGAQVQEVPGCDPAAAVPVMEIHGTNDLCWGYDGTVGTCLADEPEPGFVSVPATMAGWADRFACDGTLAMEAVPDITDDGVTGTWMRWNGCAAPLELVRLDGGGHTWPSGWQYLDVDTIGPVATDVVGSDVVWGFFDRFL